MTTMVRRMATQTGPAQLVAAPAAVATPYFLLRVGGLPLDVADSLRFTATAAWIEQMLALEAELDALVDPLSAALQNAFVRHREHQALRRQLIDAKRVVHQRLIPERCADLHAVTPLLDSGGRELQTRWMDLLARRQQLHRQGVAGFDQELGEKRRVLKQVLQNDDFRSGVVLSSIDLDQALDKYVRADEQKLTKQARRAERSLVEYLLRTTAKTSPFSTLTSVCAGSFAELPTGGPMLAAIDPMAKQSYVRLHIGVLAQIGALIIADPSQRQRLPVALTPSWRIEGRQLRYLRRRSNAEATDTATPGAIGLVHEDVFYLPLTDLLHNLLRILGSGASVTLAELAAELRTLAPAQASGVESYLRHLVRLGLLIVPQLQVDIHSEHPLAAYRAQLEALQTGPALQAAAHLALIDGMLTRYRSASAAERRDLLLAIQHQVEQCYADLGRADLRAPRTLVYEDTVLHPQRLAINVQHWQGILQQLESLQTVLPLFDVNLPRRLVMKGFFRARYGVGRRCDDLATFAHQFQSEFYSDYQERGAFHRFFDNTGAFRPRPNDFQLPELEQLNAAMQASTAAMQAAFAALPAESRELVLDDAWLTDLQPYVPLNACTLRSDSFFGQLATEAGEPRFVINQTYTGLTAMFSRFAHFLNQEQPLVDALRDSLDGLLPEDAVFAEIKGGFDSTNLNLHPQVTPYEIVCPGDVTLRPLEEQIHFDDLYIVDDLEADRLRLFSRRLDREVIPVYLGFLMPIVLPEVQQVLLNFSPSSLGRLNLWAGIPVAPDEHGITFLPRVRYGQLVLHRAVWKLMPAALPQRNPQETDAEYLLNIGRWRRRHGIPARVFVTPEGSGPGGVPYKPFYVDFDSYFAVMLLDATVRTTGQGLTIAEMLPDRDTQWLQHAGQAYVSEFVLELHQHLRG